MLTGGCLCGKVRYEAEGEPYAATVCHCETCRRSSGAPMVAWFCVPKAGFRLTGETKSFQSSATAERRRCADCGSQLLFDDSAFADEIEITTASLDDPQAVPPTSHTWVLRQLDWVALNDGLPRHEHGTRSAVLGHNPAGA